ncbi:hypothetical protein Tco_0410959 [Tanacetum coccineum]
MSFSKRPGKNTPQCYTKPLDSLKNWNNRFFWVDERVFPTVVDWRVSAPKDEMPVAGSYSPEDVVVLNTRRTPIQKQPEALLCLVGLSRRYFLGDDVYPTFLNDDDRGGAPNPTKVKTGTRPRTAHDVPLLIVTTTRVIAMDDATGLSSSSGTPSTVEKSPLDFSNEDSPRRITESDGTKNQGHETVSPEVPPQENVPTDHINMQDHITVGVTPEISLEKEVAAMGPLSTIGEKSTRLDTGSTLSAPTLQETPADVSNPAPCHTRSRSQSLNGRLPRRGGPYSAAKVAMGSQLRLRFKQEVRLLKRATEKVAQRDQRIQAREEEIKKLDQEIHSLKSADTEVQGLCNQTKNLEALLEAEVDMKKATEAKNVELAEELESLRAKFSDLQVNNTQLSQQVSSLQAQITGEELIKAAFEEFKRYEDDKVEQRYAEMDARLDKLSIVLMKSWLAKGMSEGLQYGIEHGKADRDLEDVEAYDPEANDKFVKALQDLKCPVVDQLERLKDSLIDLIMASLHLESDTGEDAPQWIRDLRPSSSQLKIPIYPEVCDPKDPWAVKEEISLEDAIAANVSRAEKKKKCRVVCHTHGVGSAHHARSDGVVVSVPTAAPQGLAILLMDAATQIEGSEGEVSPRLIRSKSLPPMFNSEWP